MFDNNHLDNSNYQFYQLLTEESGHHHVKCHQFYNNLKIFTDDLIFHFDSDGKYYFLSGSILSKINLDTKSNIQPVNLIKMYLNERNKDGIYYNPKDSCFDMEFGYYDLNAGISYASQNITKAWKIKPLNKDFPFAFINDLTSEIIYYDNGFRD